MIGDGQGADYEASTQFVDVNNLSGGGPQGGGPQGPPIEDSTQMVSVDQLQQGSGGSGGGPAPTTDHSQSGYEGSTQFVDINQLKQGNVGSTEGVPQPGQTTPIQDPLLQQNYQFSADSVQRYGEHTLIFGRNQQGHDVVLKQVWDGHPDQMPEELRVKVSELAQLHHPNLTRMNGLFASHSGCWVELERPLGMRLGPALSRGPQSPEQLQQWAPGVCRVLMALHKQDIVYANLTPDAIWFDEQSGAVKLEPFDVLAFEPRGDLGPFGPPELRRAVQAQDPRDAPDLPPKVDVFSFAMIVLCALTGAPDISQLEKIEKKKLKKALQERLAPNPDDRADGVSKILRATGWRGTLDEEERFDRRVLIPAVAAAVLLLLAVFIVPMFMGPDTPAVPPQAGVPEMPAEDREPTGVPPGVLEDDERIVVLNSYIYSPPSESNDEIIVKEETGLSQEEISKLLDEAEQALEDSRTYKNSDEDYRRALEHWTKATRAQEGELTERHIEIFERLMDESKLKKWRNDQVSRVEDRLFGSKKIHDALIPYRSLALIDPDANAMRFFEEHNRAQVKVIEPVKDKEDDK